MGSLGVSLNGKMISVSLGKTFSILFILGFLDLAYKFRPIRISVFGR